MQEISGSCVTGHESKLNLELIRARASDLCAVDDSCEGSHRMQQRTDNMD